MSNKRYVIRAGYTIGKNFSIKVWETEKDKIFYEKMGPATFVKFIPNRELFGRYWGEPLPPNRKLYTEENWIYESFDKLIEDLKATIIKEIFKGSSLTKISKTIKDMHKAKRSIK